jgi:Acyltransferase family.
MRRYDIDSLRVIAFALLIFYHVGMFFVPWSFHIKNSVIYEGTVFPMLFLNQWRLALLFVISGMGTYYALTKRSAIQFANRASQKASNSTYRRYDLCRSPQVYFERLDKGQFSGSYFDFWP